MTIPTASSYPSDFDTDTNLFVVHDSLRMTLAQDYNLGDTSITVEGDATIMSRFPSSGIITLTEQCDDDVTKRAISLYYGSKTDTTFDELELLTEFEDMLKPKDFTHVTLNVVSVHHNYLKDAIIAIEEFVGVKGTIDTMPLGDTLEGRINFIRKLVFTPRAWFSIVGSPVGLVPLEVTFINESCRVGPGDVIYLWDFGDQTCSVVSTISVYPTISVTSVVPLDQTQVIVQDIDAGAVTKTYACPGKFDVKLTVSNIFGEDTVIFEDLISARLESPNEAIISFIPKTKQYVTSGLPLGGGSEEEGGGFDTPPTIRSMVDTFVDVQVPTGTNPVTDRSYGGEVVDGYGTPLDPITTYTWSMGDDLTHTNSRTTRALYSVGGLYDLKLRADTTLGAYRITTYPNALDIVESLNLWLWTFTGSSDTIDYLELDGEIVGNEFGLVSETFKTGTSTTIGRDDSFLDAWYTTLNTVLDDEATDAVIRHAKKEFRRNVGFSPVGTVTSGNGGSCLLFYAGGGAEGSSLGDQAINVTEHYGFFNPFDSGVYSSRTSIQSKPWNWVHLPGASDSYFLFGQGLTSVPSTNPSNQVKTTYDIATGNYSDETLTLSNYKNGAHELTQHVSVYSDGIPTNGWFAVYRSTWKNSTGFFLRNDGVGTFFRLKSFYKTEGVPLGDEFVNIKKLTDLEGPTKLEGQLVPLTNGIFFFNNSGNISAYNDTTGSWETGGPSSDSIAFTSVQDTSVSGFNSGSNTLLAASNGDYTAYLSYDYSSNAFVKFNGQDLTFSILTARPTGSQFLMGVY